MEYPTGPAPTRRIVKDDQTTIINRGGFGAFILTKLLKQKRERYPASKKGKEITVNG